jgi:hypothetical protein
MPNPELHYDPEQEKRDRATAKNAVLVGGLSVETMMKVEDRLGDVDWRGLAVAQDTLFMVTNGTLGIRYFWATLEDDGRMQSETLETTDTPDQLANRMYEYATKAAQRRVGG